MTPPHAVRRLGHLVASDRSLGAMVLRVEKWLEKEQAKSSANH